MARPVYSSLLFLGAPTPGTPVVLLGGGPDFINTIVLREVLALIPSGFSPQINTTLGIWETATSTYFALIRLFDEGIDNYATDFWTGRLVIPPGYGLACEDVSVGGTLNLSCSGYELTP